jgi:MinD superfamily P-loop ATPase
VISGKGGTGKTSITAGLSSILENIVTADCDVDGSNLHLLLSPNIIEKKEFSGGYKAEIMAEKCTQCGSCFNDCRFGAVNVSDNSYSIEHLNCEGCGTCEYVCPQNAINLTTPVCGHVFKSQTRFGPMMHARLFPGADNSGKLVSKVRELAREKAKEQNAEMVLIDGPPGIGCPTIASLTGCSHALIVTEPTLSGIHDMKRVFQLAQKFNVNVMTCINKYDINHELATSIERYCMAEHIPLVGRVPFDPAFIKAQNQQLTIAEYSKSSKIKIHDLWGAINKHIKQEKELT